MDRGTMITAIAHNLDTLPDPLLRIIWGMIKAHINDTKEGPAND